MANPALSALSFIIGTLLSAYALVPALRFVMQLVRADYFNPIAQFIVKLSDPILKPMRRVIPSFKRYDTSSLLMTYGVLLLKTIILGLLAKLGASPAGATSLSIPLLLSVTFIDLVSILFNIFIFALFIMAILSWIPAAQDNPAQGLLNAITRPVLNPVRQIVPPIGGLDLSVFFTIIALWALKIFVTGTLYELLAFFV